MPTISDVARLSGVTRGTVSRAFNGYEDISPATKERILKVAQELGYIPNRSARNIALKNKKNIAMIFSDFESESQLSEVVTLLIKGASQYAHDTGMELTAYFITPKTQAEKTYDQFCQEHSLSGALLFGIRTTEPWNDLHNAQVPCITVDVEIDHPRVGSVLTDDMAAFEEISNHLIEQGHRRIAILYGRRQAMVSQKRWRGLARSFRKHGVKINPDWIIETDFMKEIAYERTKQFLTEHPLDVTAFLCMSDLTAFSAIRAITHMGYRVPHDYSVTGYDGFSIGEYSTPSITTIDQNFFQKGYNGAKLLDAILEDPDTGKRIIVPYTFIKRDSVGLPPAE